MVAASRNILAWRVQAASQVGCRLAVASRAKTRRLCPVGAPTAGLPISARNLSTSERVGALFVWVDDRWSVIWAPSLFSSFILMMRQSSYSSVVKYCLAKRLSRRDRAPYDCGLTSPYLFHHWQ